VLNLYSYTGGFSVAAALGGATAVTSVDVAPAAIALARENFELNDLRTPHQAICSDVSEFLEGEPSVHDLVIADPPSFAPNEASVARAEQSYAALHRASLSRVVDGGLYLAASCSSHISREMFEHTLLQAARESGHVLQVLERSGAPFDHPRLLAFPEGDYLKVLLLRVSRQPRAPRRGRAAV
jgi:23S rRNA (cytosine1962-C5)-methyltransferase